MNSALCQICNFKEVPKTTQKNAYVKNQMQGREDVITDEFGRSYTMADASVLYCLSSKVDTGGVDRKQLDMYSGLTGYHIRTVPGKRWHNPVLIGAGSGMLAVVDRYAEYDMIRVTDSKCGLKTEDFDDYDVVKDSVDLDNIEDISQISLPKGRKVVGLTILPRGILVANISGGSRIEYAIGLSTSTPLIAASQGIGHPSNFSERIGPNMQDSLYLTEDGIKVHSVKMEGTLAACPLPTGYTSSSIAHGRGIANVLAGKTILRLPYNADNYLFTNGNDSIGTVISPSEKTLKKTYELEDFDDSKSLDAIAASINDARSINSSQDPALMAPVAASDLKVRKFPDNTTRQGIASRKQRSVIVKTTGPTLTIDVIDIDKDDDVIQITGVGNMLAEAVKTTDVSKPIFRLFYSNTYNMFSDAGWTYGYEPEDGSAPVMTTNGTTPICGAMDTLVELGRLKMLDIAVVLVDTKTQEVLYRDPKPGTWRVYAGSYASAKVDKKPETVAAMIETATTLDGLDRTGDVLVPVRETVGVEMPGYDPDYWPVAAFNGTLNFDKPCEMLLRGNPDMKPIKLTSNSWSQRDNSVVSLNPALQPEWRKVMTKPEYCPYKVTKSSENGLTSWDFVSTGNDPSFQASIGGGFFYLDLPKERTRLVDELNIDIQEAMDKDPIDQATIDTLTARIEGIDINDFEQNPVQFKTQRSILNKEYTIEKSPAQVINKDTKEQNITDRVPETASDWEVCKVTVKKKDGDKVVKCGIGINPNIRTWIGLDIKCNYWGIVKDGIDMTVHPATRANGLGISAGRAEILHGDSADNPFDRYAGTLYEAGYIAFEGSRGMWAVTVLVNGKPIKSICTQATYQEQISGLAPTEIQDELLYDMNMKIPQENGFHRGRVWYTDELVDTVEIKAKLWNLAYAVSPFGFNTVDIKHAWSATCPGYNPGYRAGSDCESPYCGNVTCISVFNAGNTKLSADSPVWPLTKQLVWEGSATYELKEEAVVKGVGRFMDCYFGIDLMNPMNAYDVDISQDNGVPTGDAGWF